METEKFEIVITSPNAKEIKTVTMEGTLDETKAKTDHIARENIGSIVSAFATNGFKSVYQKHYLSAIKCPKCGEIIPIEHL
ncbi:MULTISPECIES: hypothetical protein [Dehalococcoides]|uniref:Uncharacterized protein n=1 Tax=Dehalococcoides mccartyi TaxID=61435 RepID=A0AB38Z889_9CHLR|nr:hypothetical protein [Dehalococcoides mccartyi]OBW61701.1 MAG: hypothetical protein A9181_01505 [Dehalococcoides mccartyi]WRO06767.1 hypothetical protein VLL09_05105 [Dehalococcoides mccartyi]